MPGSSPGMTSQYADLRVHKLVLSISQRRKVVRDRSAPPPSQTPRLSSISITARNAGNARSTVSHQTRQQRLRNRGDRRFPHQPFASSPSPDAALLFYPASGANL